MKLTSLLRHLTIYEPLFFWNYLVFSGENFFQIILNIRFNGLTFKLLFFSQVVTATVLKKWVPKGIQSVATKIAIQMACKLGGEPWTVPIPVKGLMVIGKF